MLLNGLWIQIILNFAWITDQEVWDVIELPKIYSWWKYYSKYTIFLSIWLNIYCTTTPLFSCNFLKSMMYLPPRTVLGKISFWQKDTLELAQPSKI